MSLKKTFTIIVAALLCAPPVLAATVVIQPANIVGSSFKTFLGAPGNLIDQSGLSPKYFDGATPTQYQDYILTPRVPTHEFFTALTAFQTEENFGYIDFSLGGIFSLTNFALWNPTALRRIGGFDLLVFLDESLTSPVNVGPFKSQQPDTPRAQSFAFKETPGAFVRLKVTSNVGPTGIGITLGEVAFGGTATAVSEPATAALLGLALVGFGVRRRRLS